MSALTTCNQDWQTDFLQILPAIQNHAKFRFRKLPAATRDESIQEAIAAAVAYRRLAVHGRLHVAYPSTIATNAVRYVRNGRHVGGHQDAAKDVMSPACQRRRGVHVHSYHAPLSSEGGESWRHLTLAGRGADIPDLVAFRIDFADWLGSHAARSEDHPDTGQRRENPGRCSAVWPERGTGFSTTPQIRAGLARTAV